MSRVVVVVQARTNSSRLPAKVLLPIGGLPLAVLAAKRAGNLGMPVIVATSQEASDDTLAKTLQRYGVPCFRGSLNNTLSRFIDALSDMPADTLVFRLTADNPLPDGRLLKLMEDDFRRRELDYLCCNGSPSGLPYGVSAEVFRLESLRDAANSATIKSDLEHVTPWVIRKFGKKYLVQYQQLNLGQFRATIDTLDDYLSMESLFDGVDSPLEECAIALSKKLEGLPFQPSVTAPMSGRLVLGTAQFGQPYGINNVVGKPTQELATRFLKTAISNGVTTIDTAHAYNSESVIGEALQGGWGERVTIVTKLSPLASCPDNADDEVVRAFVNDSVYRSLIDLRSSKIDVLMLHRAAHLTTHRGRVLAELRQLVDDEVVSSLGVSVQTPDELNLALAHDDLGHIQLPFNILDWRWEKGIERIKSEKKKRKLVIHVRSAFLQGLLATNDSRLWQKAHLTDDQSREICKWLDREASLSGVSRLELCLNFVNSQDWVDGVVVGVETEEQLRNNLTFLGASAFDDQTMNRLLKGRPLVEFKTLNPAEWEVK